MSAEAITLDMIIRETKRLGDSYPKGGATFRELQESTGCGERNLRRHLRKAIKEGSIVVNFGPRENILKQEILVPLYFPVKKNKAK